MRGTRVSSRQSRHKDPTCFFSFLGTRVTSRDPWMIKQISVVQETPSLRNEAKQTKEAGEGEGGGDKINK